MAPTLTTIAAPELREKAVAAAAAPTVAHEEDATLYTVDDLVRQRARTMPDRVVVAYPSAGIDYVDYTMRQLDVFAYRVARHYAAQQLPARTSSAAAPAVVAVLGPSNLEYLVTMLGLMKLGHTILFLSTRISAEAIASLMAATGAQALLADPRHAATAAAAVAALPPTATTTTTSTGGRPPVLSLAGRPVFEYSIADVPADLDTRLDPGLDHAVEAQHHVYIIHSSGSTGLPKPIFQTQRAALVNYAANMDMRAFITLPLYHNHGICNLFRAVHAGKSIHMYNADLPLTAGHLEAILGRFDFEIFYGVPYALKLLAESATGIALLRRLKVVMYGGSACPDELGNMLVDAGVNLVGHYGATEVGQLMTSFRPPGDKAWNYVRETDAITPFLDWVPRGPNLFECCVRDGWPAKLTANRPDGAYATKDLFEPHPTIPRAWKYVARLDDTVALVNGEKFSPVALEGRIRSDPWVTEAVVFGAGRPYIGLLLVAAPATAGRTPGEVVDHVWPLVEAANRQSEAYGRLARNMIRVLPPGTAYPRTDKGSIIRQAVYRQFAAAIDAAYDEADERLQQQDKADAPRTEAGVRAFLRGAIAKVVGGSTTASPAAADDDDDVDFFARGMDSLQAIQLRQAILGGVDVGGHRLGSNVVFDHPTVAALAAYLHGLRTGAAGAGVAVEDEMQALIETYSALAVPPPPPRTTVVVTGATGSLGAHVVARLLAGGGADPAVQTVLCLVRAPDAAAARRRVRASLVARRVWHTLTAAQRRRLQALPFDQAAPRLGLDEAAYWALAGRLRAVVHCAWSVNFNLRLSAFARDGLAGVQHFLELCLAAQASGGGGDDAAAAAAAARPPFSFCSSVSAMARFPGAAVPETVPELGWAQGMGYAQAKAVAEHLCARAAAARGVPARVLRVGQIVADTRFGIWNATEAIPLMLQSALTIGALPRLPERPSWLPVDTVAAAVVDIALAAAAAAAAAAGQDGDFVLANVANSRTFDWTADLLPALRAAGLAFDDVSPREWVERLRAADPDPVANPPIKLLDFFASKYDRADADFAPSKTYVTDTARRLSPALAAAPVLDPALVRSFVRRFRAGPWKTAAAAAAAAAAASPAAKKTAVILDGGASAAAAAPLADALGAASVAADALHARADAAQAAAGGAAALPAAARQAWLARLRRHVRDAAYGRGYDVVVVRCAASPLLRADRDALRVLRADADAADQPVEVVFVDVQAAEAEAEAEAEADTTPAGDGDGDGDDAPAADEEDVVPVDAAGTPEEVVDDIRSVLQVFL